MPDKLSWYQIQEVDKIDSPSLIVYKERVFRNLQKMIAMTGDPERLMPHVKTHKMEEIVKLHLSLGIMNFKCATIAEAEMLGSAGAKKVLIALQPVGPKFQRIVNLVKKFPSTQFSVIIDDSDILHCLNEKMIEAAIRIGVYLDLNVGMNRTGIVPGKEAEDLIESCSALKGIDFKGIHAYDGHNTITGLKEREDLSSENYYPVYALLEWAEKRTGKKLFLVAGGTPTFPIHAKNNKAICSPGTTVLWDVASQERFPDLIFEQAAVLVTRVISIIGKNLICLDLGHKAIAAETPMPRVKFLNHTEAEAVSQSEEHLIARVPDSQLYKAGDVFYGIPWHICPTCALYQEAVVVEQNHWITNWSVSARNRYLTI